MSSSSLQKRPSLLRSCRRCHGLSPSITREINLLLLAFFFFFLRVVYQLNDKYLFKSSGGILSVFSLLILLHFPYFSIHIRELGLHAHITHHNTASVGAFWQEAHPHPNQYIAVVEHIVGLKSDGRFTLIMIMFVAGWAQAATSYVEQQNNQYNGFVLLLLTLYRCSCKLQ